MSLWLVTHILVVAVLCPYVETHYGFERACETAAGIAVISAAIYIKLRLYED